MEKPIRVALVAVAPMYYHAPLYRAVAEHPAIDFTAIFASSEGLRPHDGGYAQPIVWDIDCLEGYRASFVRKAHTNPKGPAFLSLRDWDIVPVIARGRYEVVWLHGYNFATLQLAAAAQRALRRPLLVREEQTLLHARRPVKAAAKAIALRLFFSGARGLYIGTENRKWFARYGIPPDRLHFVPYCVDNARFRKSARDLVPHREHLRRDLGISPNSGPVILTVGRLIPKKQPLALLEAFATVRERLRCTLLVVGSGALGDALRHRGHEVEDVVVAGFLNQSQIARAYACADVFTLFSRRDETWGLVVNEAMNFALPVVVSDKVGCATDLVHNNVNGFIVDHRKPSLLAERLQDLVESSELRARMGAASMDIVDRWNFHVARDGVIEAIRAAVGERRWQQAGVALSREKAPLDEPYTSS